MFSMASTVLAGPRGATATSGCEFCPSGDGDRTWWGAAVASAAAGPSDTLDAMTQAQSTKIDTEEQARLRGFYDERLRKIDALAPGYRARFLALEERLLGLGGFAAVPDLGVDVSLEIVLERGVSHDRQGERFIEGEPSMCHHNSAALVLSGQAVGIGTGYVLSDDGLWRSHSWAIDEDGRIIETTAVREVYFGLKITGDQATTWSLLVAGDDLL